MDHIPSALKTGYIKMYYALFISNEDTSNFRIIEI